MSLNKLKNLRYVVIGSGVAGMSAIEAIRSEDAQVEIILIGDEPDRYYSRPGLAYYLTREIPEKFLFPFDKSKHLEMNYTWVNQLVVEINTTEHTLVLDSGQQIGYHRLLLATGARAVIPDITGINFDGVVKLDSISDARKIVSFAKKAKSAVVVGGGITALEIAEGLKARGVRTHFFFRGSRYWGKVLDPVESLIVEKRLLEEGIQIHYQTEIDEIIGEKGKVTKVRTKVGEEIKTSIVAIAVGIQPRMKLARESEIDVERGILVNKYLETSQTDIFAAGDVAQVFDPLTGESLLDSLWSPAREQGWIAGLNMAGQSSVYVKNTALNVTRLAGLTTTIIGMVGTKRENGMQGIVRGDSETWHQVPDAIACQSNFEVNQIRLMVGEETIMGAIVMGNQSLSQLLQTIVNDQVDISSIRNKLLEPNAQVVEIINDFWTNRENDA